MAFIFLEKIVEFFEKGKARVDICLTFGKCAIRTDAP
jgi:hypothetical protein